jgi:hypothetical protein
MPRHCDICYHPERQQIENDMLDGGPGNSFKELSARFKVKPSTLLNHKENHMATIADEAVRILNEKCKEEGVNRVLNSVEVLDLIIAKAPEILDTVSMRDILQALKLKHEILGDIKEEKKVKLEWINEIRPEDEVK